MQKTGTKKMAVTDKQLKMIADIEAAVSAMTMDKKPEGVTQSEIMEMIGRDIHHLRPMVMRLGALGELDLLKRLQAAFARVGLKPTALEGEIERIEKGADMTPSVEPALKLEPRLPPASEKINPGERKQVQEVDDIEIQSKVLRILKPLPRSVQAKVLNSASVFLGVGE